MLDNMKGSFRKEKRTWFCWRWKAEIELGIPADEMEMFEEFCSLWNLIFYHLVYMYVCKYSSIHASESYYEGNKRRCYLEQSNKLNYSNQLVHTEQTLLHTKPKTEFSPSNWQRPDLSNNQIDRKETVEKEKNNPKVNKTPEQQLIDMKYSDMVLSLRFAQQQNSTQFRDGCDKITIFSLHSPNVVLTGGYHWWTRWIPHGVHPHRTLYGVAYRRTRCFTLC